MNAQTSTAGKKNFILNVRSSNQINEQKTTTTLKWLISKITTHHLFLGPAKYSQQWLAMGCIRAACAYYSYSSDYKNPRILLPTHRIVNTFSSVEFPQYICGTYFVSLVNHTDSGFTWIRKTKKKVSFLCVATKYSRKTLNLASNVCEPKKRKKLDCSTARDHVKCEPIELQQPKRDTKMERNLCVPWKCSREILPHEIYDYFRIFSRMNKIIIWKHLGMFMCAGPFLCTAAICLGARPFTNFCRKTKKIKMKNATTLGSVIASFRYPRAHLRPLCKSHFPLHFHLNAYWEKLCSKRSKCSKCSKWKVAI